MSTGAGPVKKIYPTKKPGNPDNTVQPPPTIRLYAAKSKNLGVYTVLSVIKKTKTKTKTHTHTKKNTQGKKEKQKRSKRKVGKKKNKNQLPTTNQQTTSSFIVPMSQHTTIGGNPL